MRIISNVYVVLVCIYIHTNTRSCVYEKKRDLHVRKDIGPRLLSGQGHYTHHTATCTDAVLCRCGFQSSHIAAATRTLTLPCSSSHRPSHSSPSSHLDLRIPLPPHNVPIIISLYILPIRDRIANNNTNTQTRTQVQFFLGTNIKIYINALYRFEELKTTLYELIRTRS